MLLFQSSCLLLMAVHNSDVLNNVESRKEEVQPVKELFSILQVDLPVKIEIISNRSRYESLFLEMCMRSQKLQLRRRSR